jgi:hypothetical protein
MRSVSQLLTAARFFFNVPLLLLLLLPCVSELPRDGLDVDADPLLSLKHVQAVMTACALA